MVELQRETALAWLERSYQQSQLQLLQAERSEAERTVQLVEAQYRGGRSMQACNFLDQQGVEVINVTGGLMAWISSARDYVSGPA